MNRLKQIEKRSYAMNLGKLITLAAAAKMLGYQRRGKKLSVATMHRWSRQGLRGVKLQTVRVGGTICTDEASLEAFFRALSDPDNRSNGVSQQAARDPLPKATSEELVNAKLKAHGLLDNETSSQRGRDAAPRRKRRCDANGRSSP